MRNCYPIPILLPLLFVCILSGCTKSPDEGIVPSPTVSRLAPSPSQTHTAIPTNTPTPEPDFSVSSVTILNPDKMDELAVIGQVRNEMNEGASNITIRATLYRNPESTLAQKEMELPLKHLLPGESFPFILPFPDVDQADYVDVEIVHFQKSLNTDAELDIEFSATSITEDYKFTIMGWISNQQNISAVIHNFLILTMDAEGSALSVDVPTFHNSSLLPFQRVPFIAILEQDPSKFVITPYIDAIGLPDLEQPAFSFPQNPQLVLDTQGNILLRGTIKNNDLLMRWVSCIAALLYHDQLISVTQMNIPSPLSSGESRGFGLTSFPSLKTQLVELGIELEDLSVAFFFDPRASSEFKGKNFPLNSEIIGFENTGSSLIIKGNVLNLTSHSLSSPSVQADVRSIEGFIQTANWIILDEMIEPGKAISFVLALRLPRGIVLSQMEIDVRAFAIQTETDLPY